GTARGQRVTQRPDFANVPRDCPQQCRITTQFTSQSLRVPIGKAAFDSNLLNAPDRPLVTTLDQVLEVREHLRGDVGKQWNKRCRGIFANHLELVTNECLTGGLDEHEQQIRRGKLAQLFRSPLASYFLIARLCRDENRVGSRRVQQFLPCVTHLQR